MCRSLLRAAELATSVVTTTPSGSMVVGTAVSTVSWARADTADGCVTAALTA